MSADWNANLVASFAVLITCPLNGPFCVTSGQSELVTNKTPQKKKKKPLGLSGLYIMTSSIMQHRPIMGSSHKGPARVAS
jgi:hypothetical protein